MRSHLMVPLALLAGGHARQTHIRLVIAILESIAPQVTNDLGTLDDPAA